MLNVINSINKVVRIGDRTFCKISYQNEKLSITGVINPRSNGDADSCGQIVDSIKIDSYAEGWNIDILEAFKTVWNAYHLNGMRAGTPEQMSYLKLRKHTRNTSDFPCYFEWAIQTLRLGDLQPHNGYSYGSKWLSIDVPQDVLNFLSGLPETDITPAWV